MQNKTYKTHIAFIFFIAAVVNRSRVDVGVVGYMKLNEIHWNRKESNKDRLRVSTCMVHGASTSSVTCHQRHQCNLTRSRHSHFIIFMAFGAAAFLGDFIIIFMLFPPCFAIVTATSSSLNVRHKLPQPQESTLSLVTLRLTLQLQYEPSLMKVTSLVWHLLSCSILALGIAAHVVITRHLLFL